VFTARKRLFVKLKEGSSSSKNMEYRNMLGWKVEWCKACLYPNDWSAGSL